MENGWNNYRNGLGSMWDDTWKNLCSMLGWIELIVGFITSCVLAYFGGISGYDYYGELTRSWGMTFLIFLISLFGFALIAAILFSLAAVMERQNAIGNSLRSLHEKQDQLMTSISSVVPAETRGTGAPVGVRSGMQPEMTRKTMQNSPQNPQGVAVTKHTDFPTRKDEPPMRPVSYGDEQIICPVCRQSQKKTRKICLNCGQRFV